ncbi:phosphotransferase [Mycolicibacterium obuense]|uniref:Phosphotransferase enzyme family protein n=1 Tax=Mycolicibacterium obuense TaxID=1807 RepID=A0A0J6VSQ1_9MYCO|nr:phosphotransferase [Mycolicibacterium obuense]KMO72513.1 Phosphotransferase enzyme family protein [Mycolicibacterium obuense]
MTTANLQLPGIAARLAINVARERFWPGRVRTLDDVPHTAEAVTTEWLTAVLCRDAPGAAVVSCDVVGGSDGTSSRRALQVGYNAEGERAGLPTRLFTKCASSFQSRLMLVAGGVTESETIFYRDVRPQLTKLRSPRAFHAAFDPHTYRSFVIMDDLAAEGWTFPDPMGDSISRRDAEDMVDQMAYYHAAFWNDPRLTTQLGRLADTEVFQKRLNGVGLLGAARRGLDRIESVTPPAVFRRREELIPTTMRALRLNAHGVPTLLHQDVHQGNWLRDPDGRMGLYDWQAVARGEWALDYAYAMSVNLAIEDRRAWERELLERYLQRLGEEGVAQPPTFDEAWLAYRQQPFHVVIFSLLTIGAGRFQPVMQPVDYMERCWERIATFIDDHESLDAVN